MGGAELEWGSYAVVQLVCAKHVADNPLLKINIPLSGLVLEARVERFMRLLVNNLIVDLEKDSRPNLVV